MKRILVFLASLSLACGMAMAHGKAKHIKGTVTAIAESSITVQTNTSETVTVYTMPNTKYEKSGAAAALRDLKVGDRVVIHAETMNDKLMSTEVRFGAMPQTPRPQ
jgi:Cu/Ag efflux protein CusF